MVTKVLLLLIMTGMEKSKKLQNATGILIFLKL